MTGHTHRWLVLVFATLTACCIATCSKKSTDSDSGGVQTLSLSPSSASPGQRVAISGYRVPLAQFAGFTIQVGPAEAAVVNDGTGGLWFYAPIVFDSTTQWHAPPVGAVNVSLRQSGVEVAAASTAFTYLGLPKAPGTTRRTFQDLIAIVEALRSIASNHCLDSSVSQGILLAAMEATDSLLQDPENIALLDAVDGLATDSVVIGLTDAIYAQNELEFYVADYLSSLQSPSPQPVRSMGASPAIALYFTVDDYDLATLMQVGSVVGNFGANFLDGLSGQIGSLGPVGSFLKKVDEYVPHLKNVNLPIVENGKTVLKSVKAIMKRIETIVAIIEFVINRMVASVVPTDIDSIRIAVEPDSLQPGDLTDSLNGTVYASNSTDSITFGQAIDWSLNQLGELAGDPKSRRDSLAANVNKWLERFKNFMDKYAADAGIPWDQDAFTLFKTPDMFWEAEVVTPTLYGLESSDKAKMDQYLQAITWKAENDAVGTVDLWLTPSDNLANLNIATPPYVAYTGGTFGDNFTPSNKEDVFIGDPLHIEADLPPFLTSGQTGNVTFRVGVTDGAGGYTWLSNADLTLSALFGSIADTSGTTDTNGEFPTTATKNMIGSNGVEITVNATDSTGRTGEATFTIPFVGDLLLELGFPNEPAYPYNIGDPALFAVRAGQIVTGGQLDYLPNIDIFITVNNGTASPDAGKTDSAGLVFSTVSFGSGQDSLMIYVSATGLGGISALDSTYALKEQFATVSLVTAEHSISKDYRVANDRNCDTSLQECDISFFGPHSTTESIDYSDGTAEDHTCGPNTVSGSTVLSGQTGSAGDSLLYSISLSTNTSVSATATDGVARLTLGSGSEYVFIVPAGGVDYTMSGTINITNFGGAEMRLSEVASCWPQGGCFIRSVETFDQAGSFQATGFLTPGYYYFRSGSGAQGLASACQGSEAQSRSASASGSIHFSTP